MAGAASSVMRGHRIPRDSREGFSPASNAQRTLYPLLADFVRSRYRVDPGARNRGTRCFRGEGPTRPTPWTSVRRASVKTEYPYRR